MKPGRGIKVQVLDQQFQPQLAANGMELVYGGSGKVKDVMTSARGDGRGDLGSGNAILLELGPLPANPHIRRTAFVR